MSLEAEIKTLNGNFEKLLTALTGGATSPASNPPDTKEIKAEAKTETKAAAAKAASSVTSDSLKTKVLALVKKDEPKAREIMSRFGGKLPAVKPEQYDALNAELDAALSAEVSLV